jgi:protein PET117
MYQGVIRDEIRVREKAAALKNTATSSPPLNTPSAPVQQPAAVIDENCDTCRISPPPQLLEAQSGEERRKEQGTGHESRMV